MPKNMITIRFGNFSNFTSNNFATFKSHLFKIFHLSFTSFVEYFKYPMNFHGIILKILVFPLIILFERHILVILELEIIFEVSFIFS